MRRRLLAAWAVISTPVILYAISVIISPRAGVSTTGLTVIWLALLLAVEGAVRGKFLAVLGRIAFAAVLLVGVYFFISDWRLVLAGVFFAAAIVMLVINLRDALRR